MWRFFKDFKGRQIVSGLNSPGKTEYINIQLSFVKLSLNFALNFSLHCIIFFVGLKNTEKQCTLSLHGEIIYISPSQKKSNQLDHPDNWIQTNCLTGLRKDMGYIAQPPPETCQLRQPLAIFDRQPSRYILYFTYCHNASLPVTIPCCQLSY